MCNEHRVGAFIARATYRRSYLIKVLDCSRRN